MKRFLLSLFLVALSVVGCGKSNSTKPPVDEGQLSQAVLGTWISVECESQKRRIYNFTKTADGEDVLVVWFIPYKDESCTAQKWSSDRLNESVLKYKVENDDSKYAAGKLFTYSEDFESEDSISLVGGKLQVGERLYERTLVQVELVDVIKAVPADAAASGPSPAGP